MPFFCIRSAPFILFTSLTLLGTGCTNRLLNQDSGKEIASTVADSAIPSAVANLTSAPVAEDSGEAGATRPSAQYQQGIDRASSAFVLSRSAQSQDDWSLVARRWQQAIDFMSAVPASSPSYSQAQTKVKEYRTNLTYAQQQANRSTTANPSDNRVTIRSQPVTILPPPVAPSPVAPPVAAAARPPIAPPSPSQTATQQRTFYAPIVRREGNTPVIQVTFNAAQTFDMILDTGASGTLITDRMAQLLGVVPVAATRVDTASESGVIVPLGYVNSIEVNGATTQNVMVAIAGPQLSTGLLGHDFFGHYDVTIREHEVVFRER
jgi:predicted aspartyl protease